MHPPELIAALSKSISSNRLEKYLDGQDENLSLALSRYEYNTRLSEAFYTALQALEITLRNHVHEALIPVYGSHWLETQAPELEPDSISDIEDAIQSLKERGKPIEEGRIIAELRFSFWVGLIAKRYDNTLWRGAIFKAFKRGTNRQVLHGRLNAIRRLRNRIAHHEPIFHLDVEKTHAEVAEAIRWMCPATAEWALENSKFADAFGTNPQA